MKNRQAAQQRGEPSFQGALALARAGLVGFALLLPLLVGAMGLLYTRPHAPVAPRSVPKQKAAPTPALSPGDSVLLFTLPFGEGGVQYQGLSGQSLFGLAVAPDGSFWIGDASNRILHYSQNGAMLGAITPERPLAFPVDVKIRGDELWVFGGFPSTSTAAQLAPGGRIIHGYDVPELEDKALSRLVLGEGRSVLVEGDLDTPFLQRVDRAGNYAPKPMNGYPYAGKLYSAHPDGMPIAEPKTGHVTAGDVQVTVSMSGTLAYLHILDVMPDGSFYVLANDTVLHYDARGKLIEHSRLRLSGGYSQTASYLAFGPGGSLYTLDTISHWTIDGGPNAVDVRRVNFVSAQQALPDLPTPTAAPTRPTFTPAPPSATPAPTATPIQDLATLAGKADVIARVKKLEPGNGVSHTEYYRTEIKEWLKRPANLITDHLSFEVFLGMDGVVGPPNVSWDDTADDYILFLSNIEDSPWGGGPLYELTDVVVGTYNVRDGKITYPGITLYKGWPVDRFEAAIRAVAPTPVPIPKPVYDLSLLGQRARVIADAQWLDTPPEQVKVAGNDWFLQNVKIEGWSKNPQDAQYIGLVLAPDEYSRLSKGSGHYVLFLREPDSQNVCESRALYGYYQLQDGPTGIFEVRNGKIAYAGVAGYRGYTLNSFKSATNNAIPTPAPLPGAGLQPPTLARLAQSDQVIAEVEPTGMGQTSAGPNKIKITGTYKVRNWIKKPDGYKSDTINVLTTGSDQECNLPTEKGPFIMFLLLDKATPKDQAERGPYYPEATFRIHSGTIEYADLPKYCGWSLQDLKKEIEKSINVAPRSP